MLRYIFPVLVGLASFAFAQEEDNTAVIITNYQYDQWGRPVGRSAYYQNSGYNNGYYNNPYNDPYYQPTLPGADPDRMEDLFEQNSRRS